MTEATRTQAPVSGQPLDAQRLARLHLRLGQLTLARAELEDLARADALSTDGLASLAEALWRTGDPDGAADAARAHLEAGGGDEVALAIAAEAAAAEGRPSEARELMSRLGPPDAAGLDALFAGMPRRAFWPTGASEQVEAETMFGDPGAGPAPAGHAPASGEAPRRTIPGPREVIEATGPGLWGADEAGEAGEAAEGVGVARAARSAGPPAGTPMPPATRGRRPRRPRAHVDPVAELATAREELGSQPERALVRLALVLRHDPTYAPAILDAISMRREPAAAMLRGDAQRLLGRHLEAEAAYDAVADSLEAP